MTANHATISIRQATDDDLPACMRAICDAFGTSAPFINIFFPRRFTSDGFDQSVKRLKAWKDSDSNAGFLVGTLGPGNDENRANDSERKGKEEIVGFAIWQFENGPASNQIEQVMDVKAIWGEDEEEIRFAGEVWREFINMRERAFGEFDGEKKGAWVLEMLAVQPHAQGRGVGEKLVRWGTSRAEEKKVLAFVEATRVARKVYEKCGFRQVVDPMPFPVSERFQQREKPDLIFLKKDIGTNHGIQNQS